MQQSERCSTCDAQRCIWSHTEHLLASNVPAYRRLSSRVQVKLLFRLPVFKGISVPLLREIAAIMERRTYRLGSFIFRQGENATSMFVLASGSVRIVRQMHVSERIARMQQVVQAFASGVHVNTTAAKSAG